MKRMIYRLCVFLSVAILSVALTPFLHLRPASRGTVVYAAQQCLVKRGQLYKGKDSFWRLPFSNECSKTVFVTVKYKGTRPGVCIAGNSTGEVTLYYGDNPPDAPIDWEVQYSNCNG
jgi:hypothetical protein